MMGWFGKKKIQPAPQLVKAEDGVKRWFNEKGELHREDGPAIVWPDGTKMWFKNGQRHREDGPAVEYPSGNCGWYLNGEKVEASGKALKKATKQHAKPAFKASAPAAAEVLAPSMPNREQIAVFLRRNEVAFYPANKEEAAQLQEHLFAMGFNWKTSGHQPKHLEETISYGLVVVKGFIFHNTARSDQNYESYAVKDLLNDNLSAFATKEERLERRLAALEQQMETLIKHLMPQNTVTPIIQAKPKVEPKMTPPPKTKRRMPG